MMDFYQAQQIQLIDIAPRKRQIELVSIRRSTKRKGNYQYQSFTYPCTRMAKRIEGVDCEENWGGI